MSRETEKLLQKLRGRTLARHLTACLDRLAAVDVVHQRDGYYAAWRLIAWDNKDRAATR